MTGSHGARRKPGRQMIKPALLAGAGALAMAGLAWGDVLDSSGGQYGARWHSPVSDGNARLRRKN